MASKVKDSTKTNQKSSRKALTKPSADERVILFSKEKAEDMDSKQISDDVSEESDLSQISSIGGEAVDTAPVSTVVFPSFVIPPSKSSSTIYKLKAKPNHNASIPAGYLLAASTFLSKRSSDDDTRICKLGKYEATFEKRLILRYNNEESVYDPASIRVFLNALNEKDNDERIQATLTKMAALHQKVKQEASSLC
jgi:hypothetical protein